MLLTRIAEEMELMSRIEHWLALSTRKEASWARPDDRAQHELAVRRFQSHSVGARFNYGDVQALALTSALAGELRRLDEAPLLLRAALGAARWPEAFAAEAQGLLSAVDGSARAKY